MTIEAVKVKPISRKSSNADLSDSGWVYKPAVNIIESPQELTVLAGLPGAYPDRIDVSFQNGILRIHGRVPLRELGRAKRVSQDYGIGDFERQLHITEDIDLDRISAQFADGVLAVHLPKSTGSFSRHVPAQST
jgi:HSP20 family protein